MLLQKVFHCPNRSCFFSGMPEHFFLWEELALFPSHHIVDPCLEIRDRSEDIRMLPANPALTLVTQDSVQVPNTRVIHAHQRGAQKSA
jgi:hypothetical protein